VLFFINILKIAGPTSADIIHQISAFVIHFCWKFTLFLSKFCW